MSTDHQLVTIDHPFTALRVGGSPHLGTEHSLDSKRLFEVPSMCLNPSVFELIAGPHGSTAMAGLTQIACPVLHSLPVDPGSAA